jgi:hypothetical protein
MATDRIIPLSCRRLSPSPPSGCSRHSSSASRRRSRPEAGPVRGSFECWIGGGKIDLYRAGSFTPFVYGFDINNDGTIQTPNEIKIRTDPTLTGFEDFPRDVRPPPKLQNVFVLELAFVHNAVSSTGAVEFTHGVSAVSQAQQCFSVCVFVISIVEWHR